MPLFAQEKYESQMSIDTTKMSLNLDEVIVSGDLRKDPVQTILMEIHSEKVVQPKNSGEIFSGINGFSLIKRGSYAVEPTFRASQHEQLNVQFDGGTKATHACPNRMDPITSFMNPEEVKLIEVIKGPFSVRYGNTFGGVINMVSKTSSIAKEKIAGSLSSGYESNGGSIVNILNLRSRLGKFYTLGNVSYRKYGNYEDGDGVEVPAGFKSTNYDLKMGYNFTDNQRLQASFKQNFSRDVLHYGLKMDTDEDNSTLATLNYRLVSEKEYFKGLSTHFYFSAVDHIMSNKRREATFGKLSAIATVESQVYGGKVESEWDLNSKLKLFAGADMANTLREGDRVKIMKKMNNKRVVDKIWQDSYLNTFGIFAEAKYYISDKSMFNFGVRFDNAKSHIDDIDSKFATMYPDLSEKSENVVSATVSFKHKFNNHYNLELSFGRGSRFANIEERYIVHFNIGQDPYEYVGNPDLKSEINNQFEIGFQGAEQFDGAINSVKFGSSVFYSIYEDYIMGVMDKTIEKRYSTTVPQYAKVFRNIDDAFKTGGEIFAKVKFAKYFSFDAEMAYVYTETESESTGLTESLPLTPPMVSSFKLGYEKSKFWASMKYTVTASQDNISTLFKETETTGYEVLDLKFGVKPIKNLNIGVGVLNLFDISYYNHLNYSFKAQTGDGLGNGVRASEMGRNVTIFASYKF